MFVKLSIFCSIFVEFFSQFYWALPIKVQKKSFLNFFSLIFFLMSRDGSWSGDKCIEIMIIAPFDVQCSIALTLDAQFSQFPILMYHNNDSLKCKVCMLRGNGRRHIFIHKKSIRAFLSSSFFHVWMSLPYDRFRFHLQPSLLLVCFFTLYGIISKYVSSWLMLFAPLLWISWSLHVRSREEGGGEEVKCWA